MVMYGEERILRSSEVKNLGLKYNPQYNPFIFMESGSEKHISPASYW